MNFVWGLIVGIAVAIVACLILFKTKKPVGERTVKTLEQKRDIMAEAKKNMRKI